METQWLGGAAGDSGDESEPPPPPPSNTVLASLYVQDGKSGAFTSEVHPLYAGASRHRGTHRHPSILPVAPHVRYPGVGAVR